MKASKWILAFVLAFGCTALMQALPQDNDHPNVQENRDRDRDRAQNQDRDRAQDMDRDSAYYNNSYYKRGWQNGLKHKRGNVRFKNDQDREAYEAGYAHGDRGERWQNPNRRRRDNDRNRRDRDRDQDHDHR